MQKRPVVLKSLLIIATPYRTEVSVHVCMCVCTVRVCLCVYSVQNSLFYRALLQKRPIVVKSLLIVATPYRTEVSVLVCLCVYTCMCMYTVCVCLCVYSVQKLSKLMDSFLSSRYICLYMYISPLKCADLRLCVCACTQ